MEKIPWLKGTRKALERAPYKLMGGKTGTDSDIEGWKKDFSAAHGALYLLEERVSHSSHVYRKSLSRLCSFLSAFADLHRSFQDPDMRDDPPIEYLDGLKELRDCEVKVIARIESFARVTCPQLRVARDCVKAIEQLVAKVHRKRLDYDRHHYSEAAALANNETSTASKAHEQMTEAEKVYFQYNNVVKTTLPEFLVWFDGFLTLICTKLVFHWAQISTDLEAVFRSILASLCPDQDVDSIEAKWLSQFIDVQTELEALPTLAAGMTTKLPLGAPQGPQGPSKQTLSSAVTQTWLGTERFANWSFQKVSLIGVPGVDFNDNKVGMFPVYHTSDEKNAPSFTEHSAQTTEHSTKAVSTAHPGSQVAEPETETHPKTAAPPASDSTYPTLVAGQTNLAPEVIYERKPDDDDKVARELPPIPESAQVAAQPSYNVKVEVSEEPEEPSSKVEVSKEPEEPSSKVEVAKEPEEPSSKVEVQAESSQSKPTSDEASQPQTIEENTHSPPLAPEEPIHTSDTKPSAHE